MVEVVVQETIIEIISAFKTNYYNSGERGKLYNAATAVSDLYNETKKHSPGDPWLAPQG